MDLFEKSKKFQTVTQHNKSRIHVGDFLIGKAMATIFGYGISQIYEVLKIEDNFFTAKIVAKLSSKGFSFDIDDCFENLTDGKRSYNQYYYMIVPNKYQKIIAKTIVFS